INASENIYWQRLREEKLTDQLKRGKSEMCRRRNEGGEEEIGVSGGCCLTPRSFDLGRPQWVGFSSCSPELVDLPTLILVVGALAFTCLQRRWGHDLFGVI